MGLARACSLLALACIGAGCVEDHRSSVASPESTLEVKPAARPEGATKADEQRAAAALDDFHDAAAHADEARYFGHLDDDSVFLGTDAKERWTKAEFLAYSHPHFAKGKAWSFHAKRRSITLDDAAKTAWFDEDLETEKLGPARGSGVLVARRGGWVILQYNLTLTVPNERFDLVNEAANAPTIGSSTDPLHDFAALSGFWSAEITGAHLEQAWLPPESGQMISIERAIQPNGVIVARRRLVSKDGGIQLIEEHQLGVVVTYKLMRMSPGEALFQVDSGHAEVEPDSVLLHWTANQLEETSGRINRVTTIYKRVVPNR